LKIVDKISDSYIAKGEGITLPGNLLNGQVLKTPSTQNIFGFGSEVVAELPSKVKNP